MCILMRKRSSYFTLIFVVGMESSKIFLFLFQILGSKLGLIMLFLEHYFGHDLCPYFYGFFFMLFFLSGRKHVLSRRDGTINA